MDRTNQALLLSTTESFRGLFRKGSPTRIPPGSIISVETLSGGATPATCNSTSVFAGVLLQVKRRHFGVDDSFTVRASVGKPGTGTEVRYDVNSPWIKNIKVLQRNDKYRYVALSLGARRAPPLKAFWFPSGGQRSTTFVDPRSSCPVCRARFERRKRKQTIRNVPVSLTLRRARRARNDFRLHFLRDSLFRALLQVVFVNVVRQVQ